MKKALLIALFFSSLSVISQNLTGTIRGNILDKYTLQPLIGAKITVLDTDPIIGAVTDVYGKFRIENVPVGRQTLQVTYIGYEPMMLSNIDVSSKEVILNLEMTEAVQMIKKVEVTANKKGETINKMATVSIRSFSVEESNRYAGSRNDVARMAQNYAGVQGADDSRNDIVIRGNSPTGVLFRMEGVDIPNPNHFSKFGTTGGPVSMLNNNVLANSDFMTGAFPAEYGNAIAGVFDLKMRNGNNEKHEFMFQFGFNGAELMAEGPLSRKTGASYLVNYRYSTLFLFELMGINVGTTALPKYQDASFKLNFPHKKGVTSVFGIGGISNIEILALNADSTDLFALDYSNTSFKSNVGVVGVTHKHRIGKSSYLNLSAAYQTSLNFIVNDTVNTNFENPFLTYSSNSMISKETNDLYLNKKFNSKHMMKVGFHSDFYFLNLNDSVYIQSPDVYKSLRDFQGTTALLQPYIEYQYRPTPRITMNVGVHYQNLLLNKEGMIEPRFAAAWNISDNDRISFGYGLHSQMQPIEMYYYQQTVGSDVTQPNINVGFTKSHHFIAGYSRSFRYGIRARFETYYQHLFDVPVEPTSSAYSILNFGADFTGILPDSLVNNGSGRNYGAELTIEKFLDNGFYFLVTTSIYESFYKGSNGVEFNTTFNGNSTFNSLIGYEFKFKEGKKIKSSLTLDAKFTWNGGKRFTPIMIPESMAAGYEIRDWDNAFTEKYPDYLRGDFRVAFKMVGKKVTQEWAVDIQNITNRDNIFLQSFNVETGQLETTYQTGLLPIGQYRIYF